MEKVRLRREDIYKYILQRLGDGCSPTVREICKDLNIPSTSTVHGDLHYLVEQELIEMDEGRNRTIRLPGPGGAQVPLLGTVTAGAPILAVENIEHYIPVAMLTPMDRDNLFALRVKGDSMIKAAILDGDIIIVERTSVARNGEIVVALIEDEATVKRFYREENGFRLQPENDLYDPIYVKELMLLGKVVAVSRFY